MRRAWGLLVLAVLFLGVASPAPGAGPLDVTVACDPLQAAPGDLVRVYVSVANPTGTLIQVNKLDLEGTGFEERMSLRDIPRRLTPLSSAVAKTDTRVTREGDLQLTLVVHWSIPSPRGARRGATLVQGPVITVRAPKTVSSGGPTGTQLLVTAALVVIGVGSLDLLRRALRAMSERRRVRNLLYVTLGLTLDAVRGDGTVPLEAWETLLLTAGYADQLDALGRFRVKGPALSVQLSDLYPRLVSFNKSSRDRYRDEEGGTLLERLEALKETVQKL